MTNARRAQSIRLSLATLGCALLLSVAAQAQPSIDASRRTAIVTAIEKAAPSVVSVNVVRVEAEWVNPWSRDFWDLFYGPRPQYRLREQRFDTVGSGFFFDREGHIVTNHHVVEGASKVDSVTLPDGRTLPVELVGFDKRTDIAVLRAQGPDLPQVSIGISGDLVRGEWVVAIGNPFGGLIQDPEPSVTVGVVSAIHRRVSREIGEGERLYQDLIQTDAAINPGNSGGPLVNSLGEVVGVNTMIFSQSGGSVGLGFAIPVDRVKRVVAEIIQHGRRLDPWAGFKVENVQALRPDLLRELGVTAQNGCLVVNILKDCPAYKAGLRPGDVITRFNGQPVQVASDVDFGLWSVFVGDTVEMTYDRQGGIRTITIPIVELPGD